MSKADARNNEFGRLCDVEHEGSRMRGVVYLV